jgi:hypothetical protein
MNESKHKKLISDFNDLMMRMKIHLFLNEDLKKTEISKNLSKPTVKSIT